MRLATSLLVLAACASADPSDPADAGPAPRTGDFVEATVAGVPRDFSGRVTAQRFAGVVSIHVIGYASDAGLREPSLSLAFPGTVGAHACDAPFAQGEVSVGLTEDQDTSLTATNVQAGRTCRIEATRLDPAGGRWQGTFSASLRSVSGDTVELTAGRFDVPAPD